jgi:hypothetical protein
MQKDLKFFTQIKASNDTREWTYVKKRWLYFPVQLTITAVTKDNEVTGYLGIATDISYISKKQKKKFNLYLKSQKITRDLKLCSHRIT